MLLSYVKETYVFDDKLWELEKCFCSSIEDLFLKALQFQSETTALLFLQIVKNVPTACYNVARGTNNGPTSKND